MTAPTTFKSRHTESPGGLTRRASLIWLAVLRILVGFVFVWTFLDKTFGLGISTPTSKAWVNGSSPTSGYLKSLHGPAASSLHGLSGQGWVDWAFMFGMLLVGAALVLGVALGAAAIGGSVLLALLWFSVLPVQTNPFVDEHVVYAALLWLFVAAHAGDTWGLGRTWDSLVGRVGLPWLKNHR